MRNQLEKHHTDLSAALNHATQDALRFINFRPRSQAEVRRRLTNRYSSAVIDQVIDKLVRQRFLDDAAFALIWRRWREHKNPRSQSFLRSELLRLGVADDVVQETLSDFDSAANAYRAGQKVARRLENVEYPKFRQRVWSYLQRRGFGTSDIRESVERLWNELPKPPNYDEDP